MAALAALQLNNAWHREVGRSQAERQIVENTNKKARKIDAKAKKIRAASPVDGAAKRLFDKYGRAD